MSLLRLALFTVVLLCCRQIAALDFDDLNDEYSNVETADSEEETQIPPPPTKPYDYPPNNDETPPTYTEHPTYYGDHGYSQGYPPFPLPLTEGHYHPSYPDYYNNTSIRPTFMNLVSSMIPPPMMGPQQDSYYMNGTTPENVPPPMYSYPPSMYSYPPQPPPPQYRPMSHAEYQDMEMQKSMIPAPEYHDQDMPRDVSEELQDLEINKPTEDDL